MVAIYDPRSPQVRQDPYPTYAAVRATDPIQHVASAGIWFLTRHVDCVAVLRDARFSARQGQTLRARQEPLPVSMLNSDPPAHTRLRQAVEPAFDAAALQAGRVWAAPLIAERVAAAGRMLVAGGEFDVAAELARPLAAAVMGRFMGLAKDMDDQFAEWADAVAINLDPFADPAPQGRADAAMSAMLGHFAEQLHARSGAARADALSVLAHAHGAGRLTAGEALSAAGLLVVGGVQPLADMISNGVAALLSAPQAAAQCAAVAGGDGPTAARERRTAADELLRFDAPIPFTARTALEDVELAGRVIAQGDSVVALLGAANRDPARFGQPDVVAVGRRPNPHLAFGAGVHSCLGAPLARLVGELLLSCAGPWLGALRAGRAPAVQRPVVVPRGYLHLPVRVAGAAT